MAETAPLRVPVEIRRWGGGARWFRLARGVSELGLLFGRALPEGADGPLALAFQLPDDPLPLAIDGRAVKVDTGDEAGPGQALAVRFIAPDADSLARIARYVAARVPA